MNLMRFRRDPLGELCGHEKVDQALPAEDLALLATTYTVIERDALLHAGRTLAQRYQDLARSLAAVAGLAYPAELEQIMLTRLTNLEER
jgi:hypothetical protein